MEEQPAKLMGTNVEQHACVQQGFWGRSGEEAIRTEQGRRGPPLPHQHEPRKGAYSYLLVVVVLFHISVQSRSMCCFSVRIWWYVQFGRVVSS